MIEALRKVIERMRCPPEARLAGMPCPPSLRYIGETMRERGVSSTTPGTSLAARRRSCRRRSSLPRGRPQWLRRGLPAHRQA
jgi:hypothetical protein